MNQAKILSCKYNLSTGFMPVLVCYLLCAVTTHDVAIHAGTATGLAGCLATLIGKRRRFPQFILYTTTLMLALLSLAHLAMPCPTVPALNPLAIELSVLTPFLILFANRKRLLRRCHRKSVRSRYPLLCQSAEATVVAIKVVLLIAAVHLGLTLLVYILFRPSGGVLQLLFLQIGPAAVFALSIVANQLGLRYFNRVMAGEEFLPIVNRKGDVIGKCLKEDARKRKRDFMLPVVRIAVSAHGMLYLAPRTDCPIGEEGKVDIPVEGHPRFGETLEEAVARILREKLPEAPSDRLRFHCVYPFENGQTRRLVYLYSLLLDDDELLAGKYKGGKLWTFRQIGQNIGQNFFSSCFEYEYDYLKDIICTREKYRES